MALTLGVSRKDITPAIGGNLYGYYPDLYSTEVHDPLDVTALVLGYGDKKVLLVSVTVCSLATQLADQIREMLEARTGICADDIILSATHTHTGPSTAGSIGWGDRDTVYCDTILIPRLLAAVDEALSQMVPVQVGIATGESQVGINRRQLLEDRVTLGQNPWGPYDPTMTVLSFRSGDRVVANIVHYGCHGTSAGHYTAISRDWPGIMVDALEAHSGGISLFLNGPEGDVGPRISNGKTIGTDRMVYVEELGQKAAADAIRVYDTIDGYRDMDLEIHKGTIRIPLKSRITPEAAQKGLEEFAGKTRNLGAYRAHYYQTILDSYAEGYEEQPDLPMRQWLLRIGDTVIVTTGCELFSEIGLRIKSMSDYRVLCVALANGTEGYFATESQLCLGGYEVNSFLTRHLQPYADHADWHFVSETLRNLKEHLK